MTQQEFIQSSLKWNNLLCPANTLELQTQIVEQEQDEFTKAQKAKDQKEMELESADCLWTIAYLIEIAEKDGKSLYAKALRALIDFYGKFTSEKAMKAVSESNWLKVSTMDKAFPSVSILREVRTTDGRKRYTDLHFKPICDDGCCILGTDNENKDSPILGKILKPANWESASSIYDRI